MSNPLDAAVVGKVSPSTNQQTAQALRKQLAQQIHDSAIALPIQIANGLNETLTKFWGSPDPQKLADEMDKIGGTGFTATLFTMHAKLAAFVGTEIPSLKDKIVSRPDTYDVSVDNVTKRVIITEKPEPE